MIPEVKEFETPFGKVEILLYPGKIHFRTRKGSHLTINRVEYSIYGGLSRVDGEWTPRGVSDPLTFTRNEAGYRSQWDEHKRSVNARKKFAEQAYPLMIEWLESEEGAAALHRAEITNLDDEIATKDREINEATKLIDRLNGERRELQEQRNELGQP